MAFKESDRQEIDEKLAALITNSNAIRAVAAAVEGTIGPKGLDIMLVDRFGEVTITNDGVTILRQMDINHPALKMLSILPEPKAGRSWRWCTTTATIMAGTMVQEGANQILKGVPVARVIDVYKARCEASRRAFRGKEDMVKGA